MSNRLNLVPSGTHELVMTRVFDAPRHLVFEALTVPALVKRWMQGPEGWVLAVCEIDLRVGGALRYEWRHEDGRTMGMSGTYLAIDAPVGLSHSERFDEDWTAGEVINSSALDELGGHTTLTSTLRYTSPEARDMVLGSNMEAGVAASYARLDALLEEIARETAR